MSIISTRDWPIVRYQMPEHVADTDAEGIIAQLDAVLVREEKFVLIFSGAELPRDSAHFMKLYAQWSKRTMAAQRRLCRGAVRIEPDERKRNAFWRKALIYVMSSRSPYPYKIVADSNAALVQANTWLAA
jgi:hypothetical protein